MKDFFVGMAIGAAVGATLWSSCPRARKMMRDVKEKVASAECNCAEEKPESNSGEGWQ